MFVPFPRKNTSIFEFLIKRQRRHTDVQVIQFFNDTIDSFASYRNSDVKKGRRKLRPVVLNLVDKTKPLIVIRHGERYLIAQKALY